MRVVDLFSGAGGFTCGSEMVGMRAVAAVNHWEIATITYEANHGVRPHRQSICDVDPADLPATDVLLASPVCTNHSRAKGAQPVDEQARATALEVTRFVAALKPRLFVIENVPEIRGWDRFYEWCNGLEDLGYGLNRDDMATPGQVLDSAEFGVPQRRKRWFLLGVRGQSVQVQSPGLAPRPVADSVDWGLATNPIGPRLSPATLRRIDGGRQAFGDDPFLVPYYGSQRGAESIHKPCRTVTTRDRFALVVGDGIRMLQPSELLRIMGFPPTYRLAGNRAEKVCQLGNAVVPAVAAEILRQAV